MREDRVWLVMDIDENGDTFPVIAFVSEELAQEVADRIGGKIIPLTIVGPDGE